MMLLVNGNSSGSDLLDPYHRIRVANEVNAAILSSQGQDSSSKLPSILKLLLWSQEQLSTKANFPKIHDLVEATFEEDMSMQQ